METLSHVQSGRRLVAVKELPTVPGYGCFSEPALRHLIFNAEDRKNSKGEIIPGNGLGRAIIRVGRKVLIDLNEFDTWIDSHRAIDGS